MSIPHHYIVVDDDSLNNLVCKHVILRFDKEAQIMLFADSELALKFLAEQFIHQTENGGSILFLDINMPIINGWEFLKAFEGLEEKIHKQIRIYLLSSSIDPSDIEKAHENPFVKGYYPKPLSVQTLDAIRNETMS
ncbi:response regulator [Dyadobacter psychrotolerans]|uniref:Response regulator n=1 Tax=Dyadobacter psychrotolerans TaxID=2541721 RepID=A0A4R5DAY2_9BACT|nr:response regulator [Dyadobacter psychrotolerans]TDE10836.1 response regulator [Dyadobacter psychrotolerans]